MASGTIKAVAGLYSGAFKSLTLSITTSNWTSSNGVYVATKTSTHISSTSYEIVEFDSSARDYLFYDISWEKSSNNDGLTFTTKKKPAGTITGTIFVIKV